MVHLHTWCPLAAELNTPGFGLSDMDLFWFFFPEGLLSLSRYHHSGWCVKGFTSEKTLSIKAGGCISFIVLYHRKRTYCKNTDQILVDYTGPHLARVQLTLK